MNGQPQVVCQVRTTDCPGNLVDAVGSVVCTRVPEVAAGDGVVLQGVNYFSIDAKVRFTDKQTGAAVRDVDAHVWGDIDTAVTEVINGSTVLINDCRVHDRLTFRCRTILRRWSTRSRWSCRTSPGSAPSAPN